MNKSESIGAIAKALTKFQAEVSNPKNTKMNPHFKSRYAPLNDVLNLVRPLLSKNGLSVIQAPSGDGENIIVATTLLHESGEWIEFDPLVLKADKPTAQGAGSAITYGRRYAISALLGISSEDDDDGNGAEPKTPPQQDHSSQPPANKSSTYRLSDAQIRRAYAIAAKAGIMPDDIVKWISASYKKDQPADLTKAEYDELCAAMEKKGA